MWNVTGKNNIVSGEKNLTIYEGRKLLHLFLPLFADETPENCSLFLSNRGLELFMRCNKVSSNNYLREVASHLIVHACLREKGCTFGLTFPDFGRIPTLT